MLGAALIRGEALLRGGVYFDEDNQSCCTYLRPCAYYRKFGIPV